MRFLLFLFLLFSLSCLNTGHPLGELSLRHKRGSSDDEDVLTAIGMALGAGSGSGTTETNGEECYFARKRSTSYEIEPRPSHSEVGKCGGALKRMADLLSEPILFEQAHQCPNYLAMIINRGQGEYSIDWSNSDEVTAIGKNMICKNHEAELGSGWDNQKYYHYKIKRLPSGRVVPVCSMPFPFEPHSEPVVLSRDLYRIEADEARAILRIKGVLLHPGLPVCSKHNEEAKAILAQDIVESKGHNIRPAPLQRDFSKSPTITKDVNPYSDDRGPNDPGYHGTHHTESSVPIQQRDPSSSKYPEATKSAYIEFMTRIGLESSIAIKNWYELDERSQRRKSEGLSVATDVIANFMAPDAPEALKQKAFKGINPYERPRPAEYTKMMEHVRDAFEYAKTRAERVAALSIISHLTLSEIQKYIPRLTRYYLEDARMYAQRGYYLPKELHHRIRGDRRKVDRFLQFITSSKITLNLPFGTRRVKDTMGKWVDIPNTLRALRAGEIYRLFVLDLKQEGDSHLLLPQSTALKMLRICAAERRQSLHGVDMVIADAMDAFDRAEIAIDSMLKHHWISQSWFNSLRTLMLSSRQYLRTDFLIHGKEFSTTADHCWSHGLSDPEDLHFQVDCRRKDTSWMHSHNRVCQQCETVQVWFGDMRATLEEMLNQHKDEPWMVRQIELMRRDLYDWEIKIGKLKAHQLRVAKAENDRQWIVYDVKEGTAQITLDFAMRLLPQNPRESTVDWYAQHGMVWHLGHVLSFVQGDFAQHTYVHIFEGERQDSATVTAIIRSIFEKLKAKGIRRLYIRSDQAGCYKSSSTIASVNAIANEVGIDVVGWYFSEAQAGKGPCDRYAAIVKGSVRTAVDAKTPVLNPEQFFDAVIKGKPYKGISYELVRMEGSGRDKQVKISTTKINDLSKLNAFTFEKDALRVHRFWKIGVGKTVPYTKFHPNDAALVSLKEGGALSEENFWAPLGQPRQKEYHSFVKDQEEEDDDEESVCEKNKESKKCQEKKAFVSAVYRCPIESCSKELISPGNMHRHMLVGKHLRRPERENVLDYALHQYTSFLEAITPPKVCQVVDETIDELAEDNENGVRLQMGWALPMRRKSSHFPKTVKDFLRAIYDEGARTGVKTDPRGAEQKMRVAEKQGGGLMFELDDLLTSRQIAGVYSGFKKTTRMAREKTGGRQAKKQKMNVDEMEEEDEEELDEVNQLFQTEGDEELEYESDPLFDEEEAMRRAIYKESDEFFIPEEKPKETTNEELKF